MILYRVERANREEYGFPVPLEEALDQVKRRAPREPFGNALRIIRIHYELDPEQPLSNHTNPLQKIWRATVLKFPDIGTLGVCVCKPSSQHRFGNAADWAASRDARFSDKIHRYLKGVADWQVRQAETDSLPISQVIYQDRIWQGGSWGPYDGVKHVTHIHTTAAPIIDYDDPCRC